MITEAREIAGSSLDLNREQAIVKIDEYLLRPEEQVLREYQMDALSSLRDFLSEGQTAGYINLPTGSGKSVIIAELAEAVGLKTLVLSPTLPILKQTGRKFSPDAAVTQRGGGSRDLSGRIVNATYQSIEGDIKSGRINPDEFDFIIADEAHTALGNKRHKIFKNFQHALMLGLTATPYFSQIENYRKRNMVEEGERWIGMFENSIHEMGLEEGIEREILANLDVSIVRTGVRVGEMARVKGDYNEKELDKYLNVWIRNSIALGILAGVENIPEGAAISDVTKAEIVRLHEKIKGKKTAVFGISIDHIQDLSRQLSLTGARVKTVYAEGMTQDEREKAFKAYEDGEIDILLGVDLIRMGWDSPDTEVGIYLAPTKSGVVATQELGRILRRTPNKDTAIAIQLADIFEGKGQAPILIPNVFDPYFVMRGSISGEKGVGKEGAQKMVLPKIRFSGIGIEAIIEEARSQELLRQRFNRADVNELDQILSEIASKIYAENPEISPIEFYQAFADELPFRIGSDVIEKARQAIASIDSNTAETGKRVLQYVWMRQALSAVKPYLTGDADFDSDLIQEGFKTFYEDIQKSKLKTWSVGNLVEKGVVRFIVDREKVPVGWVKSRKLDVIKGLVEDYVSNPSTITVYEMAQEISEQVGESIGPIENYIREKIAERFGPEKTALQDLLSAKVDDEVMLETVREVLGSLRSREREVVSLYFGFDGDGPRTLENVAKNMSKPVTRERVRQILNSGLKKLRHSSRTRKLRPLVESDSGIHMPIRMPLVEQRYPALESIVREAARKRDVIKNMAESKLRERRWNTVLRDEIGTRGFTIIGVVEADLDTERQKEEIFGNIAGLLERLSFPRILVEEFGPGFKRELREYLRERWRNRWDVDLDRAMETEIIFIDQEDEDAVKMSKIKEALYGARELVERVERSKTAVVADLQRITDSLEKNDREIIMGF